MTENKIIKTKATKLVKDYVQVFGTREIAKEVWGSLKVADSFLYLYRRFGKPTYDTNDEYKIAFDYRFLYRGLYFSIFGTTPEHVYLDCFIPKKYERLLTQRIEANMIDTIDRAAKDGILMYPNRFFFSDDVPPGRRDAWNFMLDNEAKGYYDAETYERLDNATNNWASTPEEERNECERIMEPFWKHLYDKYRAWADNDPKEKALLESYRKRREICYIPEVEEIIRDFCQQMLEPMPIRDCDIDIRGWL